VLVDPSGKLYEIIAVDARENMDRPRMALAGYIDSTRCIPDIPSDEEINFNRGRTSWKYSMR